MYRIAAPPVAPPPKRSRVGWIVAAIVTALGLGGLAFGMLLTTVIGGDVVLDPWALPEATVAPLSFRARWISAPLASPSGVVFGLIDDGATPAVVAIDGGTGALRWQTSIAEGAPLASYQHTNGWNLNSSGVPTEFQLLVPVLGLAGGVLFVAYDHDWAMFDASTGTLRKTDRIPASLPAVAPPAGFCAVGNDAWIAMADGRDGGLRITAAGTTNGLREDRPAGCAPPAGTRPEPYGHRTSSLQRVRAPRVPDPCMYKGHKQSTKSNHCEWWGETSNGIPLGVDTFKVFFGRDSFSFRKTRRSFTDSPEVLGIEASADTLFVTLEGRTSYTHQTVPAPGSFDPVVRQQVSVRRHVLAAIDKGARLRWATTVATNTLTWSHPLVVAADPASPTQNLYLFTPGTLIALDQASGTPRFRIETN